MLTQTKAQIELWSRIHDSQYIVKMVDYHTFNNFFIELVFEPSPEGTLKTYLERSLQPMPESSILQFIESIAKGINHMHSKAPCVVHSNIKVQNIFVFGKSVKLSGMARCFLESFDPRFYRLKLVTVIIQIVKSFIHIMKRGITTTTGKIYFYIDLLKCMNQKITIIKSAGRLTSGCWDAFYTR
jgi:serine/threonine protein kinase